MSEKIPFFSEEQETEPHEAHAQQYLNQADGYDAKKNGGRKAKLTPRNGGTEAHA